jgi:hypothetical protein
MTDDLFYGVPACDVHVETIPAFNKRMIFIERSRRSGSSFTRIANAPLAATLTWLNGAEAETAAKLARELNRTDLKIVSHGDCEHYFDNDLFGAQKQCKKCGRWQ